ncbi:MAG TPA: hypothetical protein PKC26_07980, partial [Plasticicumulans sp.]|nr:hypothetical protein [Plasticicumulans sp.]HNF64649.1 hypothetical protein [Plasticicumulans sp.]
RTVPRSAAGCRSGLPGKAFRPQAGLHACAAGPACTPEAARPSLPRLFEIGIAATQKAAGSEAVIL